MNLPRRRPYEAVEEHRDVLPVAEIDMARRARCGDREAFDALRRSLDAPARRFTRRLIGVHPAEDDIVQDAFLALYMNIERLDPPEHLRAFVFRILRNRCYDELRRQGRFRTVPLDGPDGEGTAPPVLVDRGPTPDAALDALLARAELQRAIDLLPEPQRQALILYAEEDLSIQEVAEALGTEPGTVKSRLHHARRSLMRRLTPATLLAFGIGKETEHGGK